MRFMKSADGSMDLSRKIGPALKLRSATNIKGKRALKLKMRQVLLLDDNPVQLTVRELVLRKAEIETQLATNAPSALALLRSDLRRQKIGAAVPDNITPT